MTATTLAAPDPEEPPDYELLIQVELRELQRNVDETARLIRAMVEDAKRN